MSARAWVGIDFETRSACPLDKAGAAEYAAHASTDVLCIAWQWPEDTHVNGCNIVDGVPDADLRELFAHVRAGGVVVAHNAGFELAIWHMLHMRRPERWPAFAVSQAHCTSAAARALALPGSLENLAAAMPLPMRKDAEGAKLMKLMCKPAKGPGADNLRSRGYYWLDTPEHRARLLQYCKIDVEVQTLAWLALPKLPADERAVWELDQRINARGVGIDRAACVAVGELLASEAAALDAEVAAITGGTVSSARAAPSLKKWLYAQNVHVDDMRKGTVETAIDALPEGPARRVLEIRRTVSKSSTAKLVPMLLTSGATGRARGTLQYHRATTGRWAGSGIQVQNLPRTPEGWEAEHADAALAAMLASHARGQHTPELAQMCAKWGDVHALASNSLRAIIRAADGHSLMAADYSNIEGRALAWLAGERWKLDAFRLYDTVDGMDANGKPLRRGPDLYKVAYARAFGVDVADVTKDERQIGKVQELALGYAGSIGAFLSMALNYSVDLAAIAAIAESAADPEDWQDALDRYDRIDFDPDAADDTAAEDDSDNPDLAFLEPFKGDPRRGLSREHWAALRIVVQGWRAAHPAIVTFWKNLDQAATAALDARGTVHHVGRVAFVASRGSLRCRLPSGRYLTYPFARVVRGQSKSGKPQTVLLYNAAKGQARVWRPTRLYGGLLAENITQAVARDLLAHALLGLERRGYPVVMHVHDEIVCELPDGVGCKNEFQKICEILPTWGHGLPLVTDTPWRGLRYRK